MFVLVNAFFAVVLAVIQMMTMIVSRVVWIVGVNRKRFCCVVTLQPCS